MVQGSWFKVQGSELRDSVVRDSVIPDSELRDSVVRDSVTPDSALSPQPSALVCYLALSLFIVTHDPKLRKEVKAWRQSHPDCPLVIRRFLSIAKQIRC